jgi:hypothetical protein
MTSTIPTETPEDVETVALNESPATDMIIMVESQDEDEDISATLVNTDAFIPSPSTMQNFDEGNLIAQRQRNTLNTRLSIGNLGNVFEPTPPLFSNAWNNEPEIYSSRIQQINQMNRKANSGRRIEAGKGLVDKTRKIKNRTS